MSIADTNLKAGLPLQLNAESQANAEPGTPHAGGGRRWLTRALRSLMVLWAGAWCLFAVLAAFSEGSDGAGYAAGFVAGIVAPVVLAWRYPRSGGLVLAAAGIAALFFFNQFFSQATLGGPAILLGLCSVLLARRSQ